MIISQTPFRISFFGGGTDYPLWYEKYGGEVLSTTIDKYCHITIRRLPQFFEKSNRFVWSKIQLTNDIDEVEHPSIKACLNYYNLHNGIEIHHIGDLPARSGLGSSSAFTVGLVHAINEFVGKQVTSDYLAKTAIHIEKNILRENVGVQDQIAVAHGGFNHVSINTDGTYSINNISLFRERLMELQGNLMLFYTGISRYASDIVKEQLNLMNENHEKMLYLSSLVKEAISILHSPQSLDYFGELLDISWRYKKSLATNISSSYIDQMYEVAKKNGAIGGKVLGAGGGGFMLLYAKKNHHNKIRQALKDNIYVPFNFENLGTRIMFNGGVSL